MHTPPAQPRWIWLRVPGFTVLLPGLILAYAPYWWIITPGRVAAGWPPARAFDAGEWSSLLARGYFAMGSTYTRAATAGPIACFERPTLRVSGPSNGSRAANRTDAPGRMPRAPR